MSSVDEELTQKVFENPLLLEYILSIVAKQAGRNFNIRLTNKAFNEAFSAVVREDLRTKLNVIRSKVEDIEVKEIWKLKPELAKQFHDLIHSDLIGDNHKFVRKLVGLEEVCNGCLKCLKLAESVQEYGPIGLESLKKIKNAITFNILIVTDGLLEQIANECVKESWTKEECHKKLNSILNVPVICNKLVFWISESRNLERGGREDHQKMPREVLELIIRK
uniref:F-box domain-containing protein n=1 Tax=Caenorhabditis tropicalis TaxID=1561998 RepID=A0A1I7TS04_9PELO